MRGVEYLDRLGLVTARLLAVHGTQLEDAEPRAPGSAGATVVACARSNRWTGAGIPPVERFYAQVYAWRSARQPGERGGSNLFAEWSELRRLAPGVPAAASSRAPRQGGACAWLDWRSSELSSREFVPT